MLEFLIFLLVAAIAYLVWRIADQVPDIIFRISEIQRDVAELRRNETARAAPAEPPPPAPDSPVPSD